MTIQSSTDVDNNNNDNANNNNANNDEDNSGNEINSDDRLTNLSFSLNESERAENENDRAEATSEETDEETGNAFTEVRIDDNDDDKDDRPSPSAPLSPPSPLVATTTTRTVDDPSDDSATTTSAERIYPDAFYCPITNTVMTDPVVNPEGDSYERSAALQDPSVSPDSLYENRALKAVIEDATSAAADDSLFAGLERTAARLLGEWSPAAAPADLPEAYYCPITFNLMHDPAIDADGHTYERVAIVNWVRVKGTSPVTRRPIPGEDGLYPNNALRNLMTLESARKGSALHPSVRRWKEETPPRPEDFTFDAPGEDGDGNVVVVVSDGVAPRDEESEERERLRRRSAFSCVGLGLAVVVVVYFFKGRATDLLQIFCVLALMYACCQNLGAQSTLRRRQRQMRRRTS